MFSSTGIHTRVDASLASHDVFKNIEAIFGNCKSKDKVMFI